MPVEQVIASQLHSMFVGMVVEEHAVFRVTRNADLTVEDEDADDLLAAVEMELRRRRFGGAVRLEVAGHDQRRRCSSCWCASSTSTRATSPATAA